ncbi:LPXTG cell wall anchor domain-containing protein, partial [uncultured Anaerotruncus sp.]
VDDKKLGSMERTAYLKFELKDVTDTDEHKSTGTITFKAKNYKLAGCKPGSKTESSGANDAKWTDNYEVTFKYNLWISNEKKGNDDNPDVGDRVYMDPDKNDTNTLIWGDDRAALKFEADDDAKKFYARLSTSNMSDIYAEYGDPVDADLWFYDFVGHPTVPATSKATLTLGIPWDDDDDYTPDPENCFIYELDADGYLTDVTSKFTYSEDDEEIPGWSIRTRQLGTYIVSDTELDVTVDEPETSEPADVETPTNNGKDIPNTGSSDMVNVALVAAVVSLAAAGAVAFRKVK